MGREHYSSERDLKTQPKNRSIVYRLDLLRTESKNYVKVKLKL